jgi:hypothetical protein
MDLEPPPGSVTAFLPETIEFSNDIFSAALSCTNPDGENTIRLTRDLRIRQSVVRAEDYAEMRREMRRIITAGDHFLLLTKATEAAGSAEK